MKKICAVFALFCVMFLFAACDSGSKESVYGDTDSSDSTSDKTDSDTTDTNSDDADSQSDSTADTTPDNGDSADDSDSDKPDSDNPDTEPDNGDSADDADTSDSQSDDDADTSHENEPEVGDTREADCTGLPANASWNTVSSIPQTWNGNEWTPSTEATFSTTPSSTKCRFVCNQNYEWNDSECVAGTRTANCEGLPENALWNGAASITQTWDDENWVPSNIGTYNKTPNSSECRFQCAVNYNWNGSQCVAATIQTDCTGLPENALWNTVSNITQSWSGTAWTPSEVGTFNETPSYNECHFVCKTNYSWNGVVCAPNEINAVACTGKPENAVWNSVSNITQTWNGNDWAPTTSATYNETPSTTECRYKCAENYEWNDAQCAAGTREANCTGLPANAEWNTATKIMQTWSGNAWIPSNTGSFNSSASQSECYFKCKEHYTWNNTVCAPDTQPATCKGLPENAVWNSVSEITQTWNGNDWAPSNVGTFNASASVAECRFKCKDHYSWNSSTSKCVADTQPANCLGLPANASWNTASSITQTWDGNAWIPSNAGTYNETPSSNECYFKCNQHYTWNASTSKCVADTQSANCMGLPTNAVWNTASSITQTWNGNAWIPSNSGTYNETPSSNECHYKCDTDYHWENSACISNTRTANCTGLPANSVWNTASSITQTWSSANGWQPSTSGTYSATPSTNRCYYKCASGYTRENGSCINQKTANCTGLPTNAQWNTASSITQNWDGNAWTPTTIGSFSSTPSATECKFKCKTNYTWNSSICKANSKVSNCEGLPENAEWNTASTITQTWDGNAWTPSTAGTYNETSSTEECHYKCASDYFWNNTYCKKLITLGNICTGQNRCYGDTSPTITCPSSGAFFGQDAQYAAAGYCTPRNLSVKTFSNQDVVVDYNTGLIWQQTIPTERYNKDDANTYCNNLTYAGYSDWRLPTIKELQTIFNFQTKSFQTFSEPEYDSSCPDAGYISSTPYSGDTTLNLNLTFHDKGTVGELYSKCDGSSLKLITHNYVRCVRGTTLPTNPSLNSSTVNGDVIVTDTKTGLIWQNTYGESKTWKEALAYCKNLTYAGYSNWRLPNINELSSITISTLFPGRLHMFWSSTTQSSSQLAWYSTGGGHSASTNFKTKTNDVRCVRNEE